ncbi:MAG: DUF4920 domain-containing protein [Flavobacteriales bacterium]|nr:DUF4920 domain-containing protein [Flavobacteriales bacterium]
MTRTLPLALAAFALFACQTASQEVSAQQGATAQPATKSYGARITPDGAISATDFVKAMSAQETMTTKLDCEIISSCAVKGCWMDVKLPDGNPMKVRFVDYGFFVPKQGLEGKRAILQGTASRETFDVATLRHYAEDAGKSKEEIEKITEPKHVLTFLAEGVLITE